MSKLVFKPEDFERSIGATSHGEVMFGMTKEESAKKANEMLARWLSQNSVEVFGRQKEVNEDFSWDTDRLPSDKYKAFIVNIEPLEAKVCQHEPPKNYSSVDRIRCVHCNIELVATWSEKK